METVRMSLRSGETGRELLVQGAQTDAVNTAELVTAYVRVGLAKMRRERGIACDPERKPFWRPPIRTFVGGAALPLPCPSSIPKDKFEQTLMGALAQVQDIDHVLLSNGEA